MKPLFALTSLLLFNSLALFAQTTEVVTGLLNPTGLALHNNELYFCERNVNTISKIDISDPNSVKTEVVTGLQGPNYLILNGNDLYIAEFDGNKISKIDVTDPNPSAVTVVSGIEGPEALLLDGDELYIVEFNEHRISKINITDTNPIRTDVLTSGLDFPSGLSLHGNDLYVSSNSTGKILKTDISQNTLSLTELIELGSPTDLALCGNDLYVVEFGDGEISKIDITETAPTATVVVSGLSSPSRIIKNGNTLYFNSNSSKILKFELPPTIWDGDDLTFTKAPDADWTQEANQDRITDDVWITRQDAKPIYNYKWWQDTFSTDATENDLKYEFFEDGENGDTPTQNFTATGGTKGLRWAILDNTSATNTQNWEAFSFYGTLGNPTHFYSFNNVATMIGQLERAEEVTINSVVDNFNIRRTDAEGTSDASRGSFRNIVGKKLGVWIEEENIYFTLTFNSWSVGDDSGGGGFSYTRSTASTLDIDKPVPTQSRVVLLPNPVRNQLQLFGLSHSQTYTIYNLLGIESGQGKIDDGGTVPVSDLPKGLYFLKLESGQALKFVKE